MHIGEIKLFFSCNYFILISRHSKKNEKEKGKGKRKRKEKEKKITITINN